MILQVAPSKPTKIQQASGVSTVSSLRPETRYPAVKPPDVCRPRGNRGDLQTASRGKLARCHGSSSHIEMLFLGGFVDFMISRKISTKKHMCPKVDSSFKIVLNKSKSLYGIVTIVVVDSMPKVSLHQSKYFIPSKPIVWQGIDTSFQWCRIWSAINTIEYSQG